MSRILLSVTNVPVPIAPRITLPQSICAARDSKSFTKANTLSQSILSNIDEIAFPILVCFIVSITESNVSFKEELSNASLIPSMTFCPASVVDAMSANKPKTRPAIMNLPQLNATVEGEWIPSKSQNALIRFVATSIIFDTTSPLPSPIPF